jgi:hypothetical protein
LLFPNYRTITIDDLTVFPFAGVTYVAKIQSDKRTS